MSADCEAKSGNQERISPKTDCDSETRRHPSQTFCILMGHTGAGKTSTFNHLLKTELPVSNKSSATRSVHVYSAKTSGQEDFRFTIVDTPGMNDTSGIHQDACNMHAVQKFRKEYVGVGVLPNIILLCVKATDNRIEGSQSVFIRNLRTLESIKVIDREKPNVVIVVTHARAIPVGTYTEEKEEIAQNYISIMNNTLSFSAPVVFIENAPTAWRLEKDLQTAGTLLVDGEIQPINLLNQITDMLGKNGDDVALNCVKKLQELGSKIRYSKKESKQIKKAYKDKNLDDDEKRCLDRLAGNTEAFEYAQTQFEQERKELQKEIIREREEKKKLDMNVELISYRVVLWSVLLIAIILLLLCFILPTYAVRRNGYSNTLAVAGVYTNVDGGSIDYYQSWKEFCEDVKFVCQIFKDVVQKCKYMFLQFKNYIAVCFSYIHTVLGTGGIIIPIALIVLLIVFCCCCK